ncbi:hypothetical protein ATANTOWER_025116 [Ataeniobius toweri]|uniref:Uncharacterized protein n=1 Tax=Ataeniobius toweri TaxID=208326 RepID=A0ABU7CII2_9TELE|nr:hypothetical protein [Ataeniobius toweri]
MKKITSFKQKDNRTNGCLDRANELNTFFNRFSSETSSTSSSPAHSQTNTRPSFDLQLSCHISNVLYTTSATDPSASKFLSSTKSDDAGAPFAPLHMSVSSQVKMQLQRIRLPAQESLRPV